MHTLVILIIYW